MMNKLCLQLDAAGRSDDAVRLAGNFTENEFKTLCFQQMAERAYSRNNDPVTFVYLDSVYSISRKIDFSNLPPDLDCRFGQIRVLSQIGSEALNKNADELLRDIPQEVKFLGISERIGGIAGEGNYFRALTSIPKTLTESEDLICRAIILREDSRAKEKASGDADWKAFDKYLDWRTNYINFIPN